MNRYRLLDFVRRTTIVEKRENYLHLIRDPDVHDIAISLQKERLISFLKRLKENAYYGQFLRVFSNAEIELQPYTVLKALPLADKATLTEHFSQIRNHRYPGETCYTGGSTGSPFHYFAGKSQLSSLIGFTLFLWTILGEYDWNDDTVVIGGVSVGDKKSLKKEAVHFLQRRRYISGGEITEENCRELARLINKAHKPFFLYGYPSSICQYIRLFQELMIPIKTDNIKIIFTTSEVLSDARKMIIERFFMKKVVNLYGARDGGISAGSVDNHTFIYNGIDCVAETVTIEGVNEIVLTNLDSDAFPFVRYRTGDIADVSIREEGYPFILTNLQGRTRDFIHLNSTHKIHGSQINKVFKESSVVEYQIIQFEDYRCDIMVQTSSTLSDEERTKLSSRLKKLLPGIPFEIIVVDELTRGRNNKLRNIISKVKS